MKQTFLRRGDAVVAAAVLGIALLSGLFLWAGKPPAASVKVQCPDGVFTYSLARDRELPITGKAGIVLTVKIQNHRVRVCESTCPDQVCVHSGWLSQSGQTAACVPAGVCVSVVGGNQTVDGVTA